MKIDELKKNLKAMEYSNKQKTWLRKKLLKIESNYKKYIQINSSNELIIEEIKEQGLMDCNLECNTKQFILQNKID